MLEYFKSINNSERISILAGVVLLTIFLVYQLVFSPLHSSIDKKQNLLNNKIQTLHWMQQASIEYLHMQNNKPRKNASYSKDSLLTIIDQTTVKLDVRSFIRRIEPEGENQVQIWLELINFDDLIHLLNILKRNHNISVENLSVNRQSEQALVNARITVKGGNQ